jgi:hypothetical protein
VYRGYTSRVGIYSHTQKLGTGHTTLADYRAHFKLRKRLAGYSPRTLIGICPNRELHFEEVYALGTELRHERIVGPA